MFELDLDSIFWHQFQSDSSQRTIWEAESGIQLHKPAFNSRNLRPPTVDGVAGAQSESDEHTKGFYSSVSDWTVISHRELKKIQLLCFCRNRSLGVLKAPSMNSSVPSLTPSGGPLYHVFPHHCLPSFSVISLLSTLIKALKVL